VLRFSAVGGALDSAYGVAFGRVLARYGFSSVRHLGRPHLKPHGEVEHMQVFSSICKLFLKKNASTAVNLIKRQIKGFIPLKSRPCALPHALRTSDAEWNAKLG
jgi:hypothetical protein